MTSDTLTTLIELADAHQAADEYEAGHYEMREGRACSVGCSIHSAVQIGALPKNTNHDDHAALARALGITEMAVRLQDQIFEGLPKPEQSAWTPRMFRSIRSGADYSTLDTRIAIRIIDKGIADAIRDDVRVVWTLLRSLYDRRLRGDEPRTVEWDAASRQADAASRQAAAARYDYWRWCADMLCEELAR